jgi:hypothetical protein
MSHAGAEAGDQRLQRWTPIIASVVWGLFGLALARTILDSWPTLIDGLPRLPMAIGLALALAAAGYIISARSRHFSRPTGEVSSPRTFDSLIPLLLSLFTLFNPNPNPLRDWVLIVGAIGGFVYILSSPGQDTSLLSQLCRRDRLVPVSLTIITSLLYLRTLAPTVGEADTFEFQVNILKLGISHGSGYPLYMLLGKLFSVLPLGGTAAYRINVSAAFFGVTAALVCYALARQLRASRPAAWIAALGLAVSIGLWSRAVEAEVYTLHVTLVGVLLWIAFRIQDAYAGVRIQNICALAFLFGLSLTNHLTTVLIAPALTLAIIFSIRRSSITSRQLFFWLLASGFWLLLGLSLYLYLPIRWPAVNNSEPMTWELFQHFITGQEAQGALRLNAWYADFGRYAIVGRKVWDQFGWAGIAAAFAGLVTLVRQKPSAALITFIAWAAYIFFGLSFYVPDPDYSSFLLPAHFVFAVWIALGIDASSRLALRVRPHHHLSRAIVYSSFFLLPAGLIPLNLPLVDQSADWREYRLGQYILSQPLKQDAAILADSELIAPLYYLQVAEGIRPDLDIMVLPAEDYYRAELEARTRNGQAVYLGRYLPHLTDVYYLHSVGPLTEAKLEPSTLPDTYTKLEATFGDTIKLHGYRLDTDSVATNHPLPITLYWQATQPPPGNFLVSLRLVDSNGQPALMGPAEVPVGQMYPTAAWPTNDVVADFHNLQLDPALTPGQYQLQVSLAPPFSDSRLTVENGDTNAWLTVANVTLTDPMTEPSIEQPTRLRFGGETWLLGYNLPPSAAPGSTVTPTLYWQSKTAQWIQVCAGETCQTVPVRAGDHITQTKLKFPVPTQVGNLELRVGGAGVLAECAWWVLSPSTEPCRLGSLSISGSALSADAINFNNQIVLDTVRVETPTSGRGQVVVVSAQWRGLQPMTEDYTVFVHLLGPDGIVHGQVDAWPVQGTRATSSWPINETIQDRFEVRVPDDAPTGKYQVEVGWYLLATLDRLSVVTSDGVAVDDKFIAGQVVISK